MAHQIILHVGDGLRIKSFDTSDAQRLFDLIESCRSYLREWLPWLDTTQSVEDVNLFIESTIQQLTANNGFQGGIWEGARILGVIGFHRVDWLNRSTTIGYWLGREFQGRGVMTRACQSMVRHAFSDLHLHRVEIRCAVGNLKSRAIPERLGFKVEGTIREAEWLYDHFVDHVVYGMLQQEWIVREFGEGTAEVPNIRS